MKTKYLVIIAAIFMIALATPALAVGSDYVSKYTLNNIPDGDGCGQLNIATLAQNNIFSKEIVIQRVSELNKGFVNGAVVPKEIVEGLPKLGPNFTVELLPDGKFDGRVAPGNFTATLLDGNSGKPECAVFTIDTISSSTTITFIGHAVSDLPKEDVAVNNHRNIRILTATYYPDLSKTPISGRVALTFSNHFGIKNARSNVQTLVNQEQYSFSVDNDLLGGDPAYGWYKILTVSYIETIGGHPHIRAVSANEGEIINL